MWSTIKKGSWCPECAGVRRVSLDTILKLFKDKKIECIKVSEFIGSRSKITLKCDKNHTWAINWNKARKNIDCKECKKEELYKNIIKLRKNGSTYNDIIDKLGCSNSTIYKYINKD